MDEAKIIPVDEHYNEDMLAVLRASPMKAGKLELFFDKSPNLFAIPSMKYRCNLHLGFFINQQLKGFGSMGYYDALLKGQAETVFSFYHFYLLPEARGKKIPLEAGKIMAEHARRSGARFGLSLTLKGNRSTESYIGRNFGDWAPPTRVIDQLLVKSVIFCRAAPAATGYEVAEAREEDIPVIVRLLQAEHTQRDFGVPFTEESFVSSLKKRRLSVNDYYVARDRRGEIRGVCLAWDCSSFRRTSIVRYAPSFYPHLAAYKLLSAFYRMAPFPEQGASFRELSITDYAVADRDPAIMHALLCEVYRRHHNRKYHFMNWASCAADPLLNAVRGFWTKEIASHLVMSSMYPEQLNTEMRLPYMDIAYI